MKQAKIFFFAFSLLIAFHATADSHKVDSLKQVLQNSQGKRKVRVLFLLSAEMYRKNDTAASIQYIEQSCLSAIKLNDIKLIDSSFINLNYLYNKSYNLDHSNSFYKKLIDESQSNNKTLVEIYNYYAVFYRNIEQFKSAISLFNKTLNIAKGINDSGRIVDSYSGLGISYYYQGKFDSAVSSFKQSLELSEKYHFKKEAAGMSMNIGVISQKHGKYAQSLKYFRNAFKEFKLLNDTLNIGYSIENIGITYDDKGDLDSAIFYETQSLKYYKIIHSNKDICRVYSNLATAYDNEGAYSNAINYVFKSLKLFNKTKGKSKLFISNGYLQLALVYRHLNKFDKAIAYAKKALKVSTKLNTPQKIADSHRNLFNLYSLANKPDSAMRELKFALAIDQKQNFKLFIITDLNDYGDVSSKSGKFKKALSFYLKALKIAKEIASDVEIGKAYENVGNTYLKLGNYKEAETYLNKALSILKNLNNKLDLSTLYQDISNLYYKIGRYKKSVDYFRMYDSLNNQLVNKDLNKQLSKMNAQYNAAKKKQKIAMLEKERAMKQMKDKEEAKKNRIIAISFSIFLILIILIAIVLYFSNKKKKKQNKLLANQNKIIENQKTLVEAKNKEISDSINYAKRIQEAILPSRYSLSENLKNGFVLFKPKDIVSGDFYWLEKQNETTYFAAADCTGHGVPGAMVSVVCSNALSKALLEENIAETGKLLERVREIIIQQFSHSDENVRDGMDISLCKLEGNKLQWSGANNPLWIIRNNSREVEIVKPDKQPIGRSEKERPFTTHNLTLNQGDSVYIFTDGYADQFGGTENKKYKYKPLQNLLLSIAAKPMDEQKKILNKEFEDWKGDFEQIDDVCIIGMRI